VGMSLRERIMAVYHGETPDVVPYMLDLSHWFYHKNNMPWDLSQSYEKPETELLDYHKKVGVGFYLANLASFVTVEYGDDVLAETIKDSRDGEITITWRFSTPLGTIERKRIWHEQTYAWAIREWAVKTEQDLRVLGYVLGSRTYAPRWDRYQAWVDYVGEDGVVYVVHPAIYSGMAHLLHYWMGVEGVTYATYDWPDTVHDVVDQINENNLKAIDLAVTSPGEIIFMGDNFSSDIQPPHFFAEWARPYYVEAIRRVHAAGKYAAVHIDGRLRGALRMICDTGADCADAVTPVPMGDLTPAECREEAGPDFILSGGVSPDLWLPETSTERFKQAVIEWVKLKRHSSRLIANAGDQPPPGAVEERIEIMRDLVEEYGRY